MNNENEEITINVTPHHKHPSSQHHLSSQEFQRVLYQWYEEKGLISDLRSYLRVLMISKLRHTQAGRTEQKHHFSLTKQAISLIIGEYLLRENCHYTLSILSTEIPAVANHLPFSLFDAHCNDEENEWKFDEESVANVLELIGIEKTSPQGQRILDLYVNNSGSLLSCIVSSKKTIKIHSDDISTHLQQDHQISIKEYLKRTLSALGGSTNFIDSMIVTIMENIKQEKERNAWEIGNHFSDKIEEFHNKILDKDNELKRLAVEMSVLHKENKRLRKDLREKIVEFEQKEDKLRAEFAEQKVKFIQQLEALQQHQQTLKCELKHCTESCAKLPTENAALIDKTITLQNTLTDKTIEMERLQRNFDVLTKDFKSSQLKIEFLTSCLKHTNDIHLKPQAQPEKSTSDDSSESITEEILQQARLKLDELERESDLLDLRYKKLNLS